ncbi:MAG: phosphopyruvate hydratase [Candidatus Omnitrophota bacterium]|jgi:enolase
MAKIEKIYAREILDSRGNPTVEVELTLEGGFFGRASVPSGASTGTYEALELRDGGVRYKGLGVEKAVGNVNEIIAPELVGGDFDQKSLDQKMIKLDGSDNKGKLGANAILGVSIAFCKAQAISKKMPLYRHIGALSDNDKFITPKLMVLVMEGGKHADQSSDIQEFMVIVEGADSLKESIRISSEIYHKIGEVLKKSSFNINVGFEGAYGPSLGSSEKVFQIIMEGIAAAGYRDKDAVKLAIDCAASELYRDNKYSLKAEGLSLDAAQLIEFYRALCEKYPIYSIEDGLAQDDWDGWTELTHALGSKIQLIGDDLTVTNVKRLEKAIQSKAINSILIKLNQIGTVTETIEAIKLAKENNISSVVSHRSGETEDSFIADFAIGVGASACKFGAPARSERGSKYNQLMRIEEELKRLS